MRWALSPFVTSLLLLPGAALAQDAGSGAPIAPDAGMAPVPCGAVTPEGECSGTTVLYCDDTATPPELVSYDCAADFDPSATCLVLAPEGADCAMPTGSECVYADQNDDLYQTYCQGAGGACLETPTASECLAGEAPCTETDVGTCRGDRAIFACYGSQAWLGDCPGFGGTCMDGVCVGIPEGGVCGDGIECAAPFVCDEGACAMPGAPDAGVVASPDAAAAPRDAAMGATDAAVATKADASAGGGGGGGTDSSGCAVTGASPTALMLVLALGLALRRRRA